MMARLPHLRRSGAVLFVTALLTTGPLSVARAQEAPEPSEREVTPVVADTGSMSPRRGCRDLTGLHDVSAFRISRADGGLHREEPRSDAKIEVTVTGWDRAASTFDWSSTQPVLGVWAEGRAGEGNWYDYASASDRPPLPGADHDRGLRAAPKRNGPANPTHLTFCYGEQVSGAPDLTIDKSSDAEGVQRVGDRFGYEIVVTNVGDAPARDVEVTDTLPAGLQVVTAVPDFDGGTCTVASSVVPGDRFRMSVTCGRATLEAGTSASIGFRVKVTEDARCGENRNVATVSADDEPKRNIDGKNTASWVDEVACRPSLSLEKTGPDVAHVGDVVTYRLTVTNDGEVALRDVDLRDGACDSAPSRSQDGDGDSVLSPGEAWVYRCPRTVEVDDGDPTTNTARVRATDGNTSVSATASHDVDVLHPAIEIRTSVSPANAAPGATVSYTYVVRNTGDTPLKSVTVTDDVLGTIKTVPSIAPGKKVTLDADHVLPTVGVQVVNVGTATGTDELGAEVSDTDDAVVTIVAADTGTAGGTVGGTAFTGTDVDAPATAALLLLLVGVASLMAARRRSPIRSPIRW